MYAELGRLKLFALCVRFRGKVLLGGKFLRLFKTEVFVFRLGMIRDVLFEGRRGHVFPLFDHGVESLLFVLVSYFKLIKFS